MKLSAQEEFGLRCLLITAKATQSGSVTIPEISKLECLTEPHVAKMMGLLKKADLVKSTRGKLGGYTIARDPKKIVVGDVLTALGGRLVVDSLCDRFCGTAEQCVHLGQCSLMPFWVRIQSAIDSVANSVTMQDLLDDKQMGDSIVLQPKPSRTSSLPHNGG